MEEIEKIKECIQDGGFTKFVILSVDDCKELSKRPYFEENSIRHDDGGGTFIYRKGEYLVSVDWINSL